MPDKHWNYRIMRRTFIVNDIPYDSYGIHEVYYRCGKPFNWSREPIVLDFDDILDIKPTLEKLTRAVTEFAPLDYTTGEEIDAEDGHTE